MNYKQRDQLYQMLDKLIRYTRTQKKDLPKITLTDSQLKTFKKYNRPDHRNEYHYHDTLIN